MKILEISKSSAAANAGLLLAQLGFEVDQMILADNNFSEAQSVFFQRGKNLVAHEQVDSGIYDVVIEDVGTKLLGKLNCSVEEIRHENDRLVVVSLSDLSLIGPYADWSSCELVVQAVGGVLHVSGYEDEPPLLLPGHTAAMILGVHGATAASAAVYGISAGNEMGVHIDISAQDALMQHWTRHISQYAYAGTTMSRAPRNPRGIHLRHTARAKDGWVYMLALRAAWQQVASFLGLDKYVTSAEARAEPDHQPWDEMEADFHRVLSAKDRYTWFGEAAEMGWTFAPVEDPFEVAANPQNKARGFFEQVQQNGKTIQIPGLPYRIE